MCWVNGCFSVVTITMHSEAKTLSNLDELLKKSEHLARVLKNMPLEDSVLVPQDLAGPEKSCWNSQGGYTLAGREWMLYKECEKAIISFHGEDVEAALLSRRAAERMLDSFLSKVLQPLKKGYLDSADAFGSRLSCELSALKALLIAEPATWRFALRVSGLQATVLPLDFGGVLFAESTDSHDQIPALNDFSVPDDAWLGELREAFAGHVIASTSILAIDSAAAKEIGFARIRRVIESLNFFASFTHRHYGMHRAYAANQAAPDSCAWIAFSESAQRCESSVDDSLDEWPISDLSLLQKGPRSSLIFCVNEKI
jgi:hypothetical protein